MWRRALSTVLVVAYPAGVYYGLQAGEPRLVALLILALLLPGFLTRLLSGPGVSRAQLWEALRPLLPTVALVGLAALLDDERALFAVPVVVSLSLLVAFAMTLRPGATPMIYRFARMVDPDLPDGAAAHCRQVTWVWCVFFLLNAATAGFLALYDDTWWALYTGLLAYGIMGLLFAGEYVVRQARFRRYSDSIQDRILSKIFPPRT